MKFLLIIIFVFSCAHRQPTSQLKKPDKYAYLREFYKTRDILKKESKSCKHYMKHQFSKIFLKTKTGKTIKNLDNAANTYTPNIFDWDNKTKINELYLTYEYSYEIVNEHFEISNNIKDCMNDFEHMNFIKSTIKTFTRDKVAAKKILNKYFAYISKSELSPLNVLIAANIVNEMRKFKIVSLDKPEEFQKKQRALELKFSETGKASLSHFRNKNYKEVYKLAFNLKVAKDSFKKYLLSSFKYN